MHEIVHRTVVELDDQSTDVVAVLDDDEQTVVTDVVARGVNPREVRENIEAQVDGGLERMVVLGEKRFDLNVQDVAELVALERRERQDTRGSTINEGGLFAVLRYETHIVDPDAWDGKRQRRVELSALFEATVKSKAALKRAVNHDNKSLDDVQYVLQEGKRNPDTSQLPP